MIKYLISKSATNKVRVVYLSCSEEWDEEAGGYVIKRRHGQLFGKMQDAPDIVVSKGKVKRTTKEQLELQFNSELDKYLDKGYKEINNDPELCSEEELLEIVGKNKTDAAGNIKPMLAKSYLDIKSKNIFDKWYYGSVKINGVRCLMFWDGEEVRTSSRGATNYDLATFHIRQHPKLIEFFKNHPDCILDGELFTWGETLNRISGICRSQKTVDESKFVNYYIYDVVETELSFIERLNILQNIQQELQLKWCNYKNPEILWENDDLKIVMVPHIHITSWEIIKALHDDYVSNGWEGLVLREENSLYCPGTRNNSWIKIKVYLDSEYPIVGWEPGLREEDMCFVCETPRGFRFNVKPVGTREQKHEYIENIDSIIGKNLTVKYFEMSGADTDIPQQPVGVAIRDYE